MAESPNRRLDSWKEIADYLGRDLRTVSRWEKEKGLPVHRIPGGKKSAVLAYTEEIDAWLNGQSLGAEASASAAEPSKSAAAPSGQGQRFMVGKWLRHWTAPWAAMIAVVLLVLVFIPMYRASRAGAPVRVSFAGQKLFAWNEKGRLAWEYEFSEPTYKLFPYENARLVRIEDLDGDGSRELLAVVAFAHSRVVDARTVVHCFSAQGKLLWKYEPDLTLKFRGREFEGPWRLTDMLVTPGPEDRSIWVAFVHQTWWPSFVVKLDARGGSTLQFINSGWINILDRVQNRTGKFILAAGLNNEYKSAVLAVLKEDQELTVSPQSLDSEFYYQMERSEQPQALQLPHWHPYAYFVFAPTELFRLQGLHFHQVMQMNVRSRQIEITTGEARNLADGAPYLPGLYELSKDFELESASLGDAYWNLHRQLERQGKLRHQEENCPERKGVGRVRVWLPESAWVRPPIATR